MSAGNAEKFQERRERAERIKRGLGRSTTWVSNAAWYASEETATDWDVTQLLEAALETARQIVEARPPQAWDREDGGWEKDYTFENILETAQNIVALLHARQHEGHRARLIEKLESVQGRTPEEAALHLERATRLRQETPSGEDDAAEESVES